MHMVRFLYHTFNCIICIYEISCFSHLFFLQIFSSVFIVWMLRSFSPRNALLSIFVVPYTSAVYNFEMLFSSQRLFALGSIRSLSLSLFFRCLSRFLSLFPIYPLNSVYRTNWTQVIWTHEKPEHELNIKGKTTTTTE